MPLVFTQASDGSNVARKSVPAGVFTVSDVVPGWTEVLQQMRVGDEWVVYLPPALGYGEQGRPGIPPNAVMVFRLKLLEVAPVPGGDRGGAIAQG